MRSELIVLPHSLLTPTQSSPDLSKGMVDWSRLFGFSVNPAEIILRGTVIYWFIFLLFRLILHRDVGAIAIADVMLLVLIADAASNGMSGNYDSITDGCLLIATLAGWNYLLDSLSFHFPAIRRIVQQPPLALVQNGKIQRKAMRRELITVEELESKLREQGIEDFREVKIAYLEEDGEISILRNDGKEPENPPGKPKSKKTI
ncbi:Protein of unknown function [Nitrosospira multiformis ATCC 25196]|uniref:YetF C-terminal domain-containing protein n=2 Tax=Nitrosospira multiformis TaxID=1231 RepID=Q2Y732_NITMU|nr:YetF domain-containing protein [Nitrosospira multiformis]ABB75439.1 Protein of unknown function DUF421 [Nitrosospira multiformis ATCC 25196]SEF86368.1 Protein of unknown function [Nitrosospira multiformis ATCC 25196]